MNFPLKNLELHIEDRYLISGEQLFVEMKVQNLEEIDKHLWAANVESQEVEIQITPSKVKAVTCECMTFKKNNFCAHVTAVLMGVRKAKDKEKALKAATKPKVYRARTPKKLTINAILDNVNPVELNDFIRAFAKTNANFAIAIKTRFAPNVPMLDTREKYMSLLETAISKARTKEDVINYRSAQKLLKMTRELLNQADDALALDNYIEGVVIAQCIIQKIAPIIRKAASLNEELMEQVKEAFQRIGTMLLEQPAPQLKESVWDFCLGECNKPTYRSSGLVHYFYTILLNLADDKSKIVSLLENLTEQLTNKNIGTEAKGQLLITKYTLLEKNGELQAAEDLIIEHLAEPALLLYILNASLEKKEFVKTKKLAQEALKLDHQQTTINQIEEILLQIAVAENDQTSILQFAEKRFLLTKSAEHYENIKANYQGDWNKYLDQLLQKLHEQPYSITKRDAIARILFEEGRVPALFDYILNLGSLDLMQQYDKRLVATDKKSVYDFYENTLTLYAKNHLGRNPSIRIKRAIAHLYDIGANKLAQQLVGRFRSLYADRRSLMDELSIFR